MSRKDRYKAPEPFLMGSQEAHEAHDGWYKKQKEASFDRGLRRNLKPVNIDAGGMLNWATAWLNRGQEQQQEQEPETVEGTQLEREFFREIVG